MNKEDLKIGNIYLIDCPDRPNYYAHTYIAEFLGIEYDRFLSLFLIKNISGLRLKEKIIITKHSVISEYMYELPEELRHLYE